MIMMMIMINSFIVSPTTTNPPILLSHFHPTTYLGVRGWNEKYVDVIILGMLENLFLATYDHETLTNV